MTLYQKLERKFGKYAVPDLMKYICVMYAVGFLILRFQPALYYYYLDLDPEAILHGHVWRLFTFLFYYPARDILWAGIGIFIYYSLGQTLERVWGTFRYNLFFAMGVLLLILSGIAIYLLSGYSLQLDPTYMSFSIFLAYALTFPDATFLLYFLIPIKAKYLAAVEVLIYLFLLVTTPSMAQKVSILVSMLNVGLFFYIAGNKRRKKSNIFNIRDFR